MGIPCSRFLEDQIIRRHPSASGSPLVSIIMTASRIRPDGMTQRAIESVLAQTLSDFEFIIVDDGSIDGLYHLLQTYQSCDSRILVIRHDRHSDLPALRINEGILIARGEYLSYQDENRDWAVDCLERLLEFMSAEPTTCLIYGIWEQVARSSGDTGKPDLRFSIPSQECNFIRLWNRNLIQHSPVLHQKNILDMSGLYDPHIILRHHFDHDLWIRLAQHIPFKPCSQAVAKVTIDRTWSYLPFRDNDMALSFRYMASDRNALLTPPMLPVYEVDRLPGLGDCLEMERVHATILSTHFSRNPGPLSPEEQILVHATSWRQTRLCVSSGSVSASFSICFKHFNAILQGRCQSLAFVPEPYLKHLGSLTIDTLVLFRTFKDATHNAIQPARNLKRTVIYALDDNLFRLAHGDYAEKWRFLTPGHKEFQTLERAISNADLVFSYSDAISQDCLDYNPRTVTLRTNIPFCYIANVTPLPGGRPLERRLKYAILNPNVRTRELTSLWGVLQEFSRCHKDSIEFHLWGFDPQDYEPLECTTVFHPHILCYESYLAAIGRERFDYIVCPLFDGPAKQGKSPIKYLEATVAGAVGIFSDSTAYTAVDHGITGFKVAQTPDAWLEALENSFELSDSERSEIFFRAKVHVREHYTTESQLMNYLSAFEAADLHKELQSACSANGQTGLAFCLPDSDPEHALIFLQYASFLHSYGFRPHLCLSSADSPSSVLQEMAHAFGVPVVHFVPQSFSCTPSIAKRHGSQGIYFADWLQLSNIKLVHMLSYMSDIAEAAFYSKLPVVLTLHQRESDLLLSQKKDGLHRIKSQVNALLAPSMSAALRWQVMLGARVIPVYPPISASCFDRFKAQPQPTTDHDPRIVIRGTFGPTTGQLRAIQAVDVLRGQGLSVKLLVVFQDGGSHPYKERCRNVIKSLRLEDQVEFIRCPYKNRQDMTNEDYHLFTGNGAGPPNGLMEAMASGCRVISSPVEWAKDLINDEFSGLLAKGHDEVAIAAAIQHALSISANQWESMKTHARKTAKMLGSADLVKYKLLKLYNLALTHPPTAGDQRSGADGIQFQSEQQRSRSKLPVWLRKFIQRCWV